MVGGLKVLALFGQLKHSRVDNEQTEILASELSKNGGILYRKEVFFNVLINLPYFMLCIIPVWLLIKHIDDFKDIDECDVIVVSGKKMIRFARHLRHYMFPDVKIVQIGNPVCKIRQNDILIRQETSRFIYTGKNTIKVNGLLCGKINDSICEEQCIKFNKIKLALGGNNFIGVFVGGNQFGYKLTVANAIKLGNILNKISSNMNMPLLIATDGKVNTDSVVALKESLTGCKYYFYDKQKNNIESPKVAFMSWAKYYILCGNMINDQSEYISQQKPTYVYLTSGNKKRYLYFVVNALKRGCIKLVSEDTEVLEDFSPSVMNDLNKISEYIKELL